MPADAATARRRAGARTLRAVAWIAVAAAAAGTVAVAALRGRTVSAPDAAARASAASFLDRYMEPDGRVVRRDQGNDTVSEGQAYAMLLAAGTGDRRRFDLAWGWTRAHLARPDGLMSWHWASGRVVDDQPAADADLDMAQALLVAAYRFGGGAYRGQALALARSIMREETLRAGARLVLMAGPWAVRDARRLFNPSYFAPSTFVQLAALTGDRRWLELRASAVALARELADPLTGLPPDWARLAAGGAARPSSPPGAPAPAAYGFDAVRLPLRMASSCDPAARRVAGSLWPFLSRAAEPAATYSLGGQARGAPHPASLVGAAAAAAGAGDGAARDRLLARARALDARDPTYYGSALVAWAGLALTTDRLRSCWL